MNWFRKSKFVHLPISVAGYLIYLAAFIFSVTVFIAVDNDSHSVSDTMYGIFPYFVSTFLLVEWLASKTCD
jgi:hypothetical protein